jgi:hypothetical protein
VIVALPVWLSITMGNDAISFQLYPAEPLHEAGTACARPEAARHPMTALDDLIPAPHLVEVDQIDVAAGADVTWQRVRHGALAQEWPIRVLFSIRNLLMRGADGASPTIRMDDLRSSPQRPGFQILIDRPPHEFAVGAIGKVWRLRIPFVHLANAGDYAVFRDPGFVKVAWSIRVVPLGGVEKCRVTVEVRVQATDERALRRFRCYFRLIGPFSRYIRRSLLTTIANEVGGRGEGRAVPRVHHVAGHSGG